MQVKKQQLKLDMEQQTGSKLGKEYVKSIYCHPAYLTYAEYNMRNAEVGWITIGIEIARRNINNLRYAGETTLMAKKWRTKESLDESERGE